MKRHGVLIAAAAVFLLFVLASSTQADEITTEEEIKASVDAGISWHNDVGNDSCIVLFSDKAIYYADRKNPVIEPMLKVENNCNKTITGNLGLFFQTKDLEKVAIESIQQSLEQRVVTTAEKTYDCKETAVFNQDTKIGTCYYEDFNGVNKVFEKEVKQLNGNTFAWDNKEIEYDFSPIQKANATSVAETGKEGYELKESIGNISIPPGISYLKFKTLLPTGPLHKHGYFIATLENSLEPQEKTVLDPEWWETGEYTPDADTIALWHCNDTSGTTVTDATGNYDGTATNALIWDTNNPKWGVGACGLDELYYFSNDTLWDADGLPAGEWTMELWMYPMVTFQDPMTHSRLWNKTNVTSEDTISSWIDNLGFFYINIEGANAGNYDLISSKDTWAANTWFHLMVIYDGTNWAMYVDGVRETIEVAGTQMEAGTQTDFHFGTDAGSPGGQMPNALFDEIAISDVNRYATPWIFSDIETEIISLDGYNDNLPLAFSYTEDENITIGFYALDTGYTDLNFSAWYGTTQGAKTNPIISDINLAEGVCLTDMNTSSKNRCNWDWNISAINDGNYFITIELNNGYATDTNSTEFPDGMQIDNSMPTVTTVSPIPNALAVSADTNVTATFNKNMDPATITTATFVVTDTTNNAIVSGTVSFDSDTNTATFNPNANLAYGADHNATITIGAKDPAGNPIDANYSWAFKTEEFYSIPLSQGWNLISLPTVPNNTGPATVIASVESDLVSVWTYVDTDDYNTTDGWLQYDPDAPCTPGTQGCLGEMTAGYGYWMNMTDANTLEGAGSLFTAGNNTPPSRTLVFGWNLIGHFGGTDQRIGCVFGLTDGSVGTGGDKGILQIPWSQIIDYDGTTHYTNGLADDLEANKGYWIMVPGLTGGLSGTGHIYGPVSTDTDGCQ